MKAGPDADGPRTFLICICDQIVQYNENTELLKDVKKEQNNLKKQANISIIEAQVKMLKLKMPNWRSLSLDRTYYGTTSKPILETTNNVVHND